LLSRFKQNAATERQIALAPSVGRSVRSQSHRNYWPTV